VSAALTALLAHARDMPAATRTRLAEGWRAERPGGTLLVETCHRVELYGSAQDLESLARSEPAIRLEVRRGETAARHLVRLAVGLDSTVLGEDQLLHQLRESVAAARRDGGLPDELDRLCDISLRAGRRARSWLPAQRTSLAEVALNRVIGKRDGPKGAVLVVGVGEMGRRAASALRARGAEVLVASRTPERAQALAREQAGRAVAFDPGPQTLSSLAGVVVALNGRWPLATASREALANADGWLIDLSAPPALAPALARALGTRLLTIDDLANVAVSDPSPQLLGRLEALVDEAVASYEAWAAGERQRAAARALAERSAEAQRRALAALWAQLPTLDGEARAAVEAMASELAEQILRDPLERLRHDHDGRRARAARELFGL
jgi:glutamyl-tRNA reductase